MALQDFCRVKYRWIVLGCAILVGFCQGQGISVFGQSIIRPHAPFTVSFANSLTRTAQFDIALMNLNDDSVLNETNIMIARKSGKSATLQVGNIPDGAYRVLVTGIGPDDNFQEEIDLLYHAKTESIFIQLDKPVYKPGDVLRFRVVVVDEHTRPATNVKYVSVTLLDPRGNMVSRWPYGMLYKGVFESSVQLASAPELGSWTLMVGSGSNQVSKQIELKEYVLPKFSIKVHPAELLIVKEKRVKLDVATTFTSGNPVEGTLIVDLFLNDVNKRKPDHTYTGHIKAQSFVEFKLKDELEVDGDSDVTHVFARVSVVEIFSNKQETIIESIPVYRNKHAISVIPSEPMFEPGKLFTLLIMIKDHYGIPARGGKLAAIDIIYDGDELEDGTDELSFEREPDEMGVIALKIVPPASAISFFLEVHYDGSEYEEEINAAQSLSHQYITVTLNENRYKVRPNKEVVFEITCTERFNHFSYAFVARGSIIDAGHVNVANKKKYSFRYKLLPAMAPKARLIVSFIGQEYLIYDVLDLNFDVLGNDFEFFLDDDNYHPGQDVYVDLSAAKDSYVAFHGIDQSVLHLGHDGHLFSRDDVLAELDQYCAIQEDEQDPFSEFGIFLRTTSQVDAPYAEVHHSRSRRSLTNRKPQSPTLIRTVFPETWFWRNYSLDGWSSSMTIESVIPDTVTSWFLTGFALSPTLGLGIINQPRVFTVDQPFYVVANLPYSIKRDEVAVIRVTVFNFLGSPLTTDVTLFNKNNEIEFVENSSRDNTRRTKAVLVPANNGHSVSFLIKAKKLGEIAINIEAVNSLKSDSVEHILRVIPESHLIVRNEARFIDLTKQRAASYDISIDIPRNVDEGSVFIKFTLDPDLLGCAVKNLESLITMPSGCGEQNMKDFVPNVVILDYLSETKTINKDIESKAIRNLKGGYQNQLKYRKDNGSFSVFVSRNGGTFLTAFVAQSFKLASKYISIDTNVIDQAYRWLLNQQQADGRFIEVGSIWSAAMQGGLRSSCFALTAFVLAAILDAGNVRQQNEVKVQKSINYLTYNLQNMDNSYDLALTAYSLSFLPDRQISKQFLDKLTKQSTYDQATETRHWNTRSYGVEIAGYAVLSYIAHDMIIEATPVVRWLTSQRYGEGGYRSTQDTFVALKALAQFAAKTATHKNNYRVTVRPKAEKMFIFDVDSHKIDVQELDLDSATRNVNVQVNGVGTGIFQISYQYNLNIIHRASSFNLEVNLLPNSTYYRQELSVCVSFIAREAYQYSNMALVEVFFPSGIVADENSVRDLSIGRNIQKTELRFGGTSLVVYYIRLGAEPNCFGVTAERHFNVALHRPAHVVVYDYYDEGEQSDRFAIASYEGKVMQVCNVCEDEDCETLSCQ